MTRRAWTLPCTFLALLTACGDDGGSSASQTSATITATATATVTASDTVTTTPTTGESASATATDTGTMGSAEESASVGSEPTTSTSSPATGTGDDSTTGGLKLDVGADTNDTTGDSTTGQPIDKCKASDDDMNVGDCTMTAPPDAFEPDVQWTWDGPGAERESLVTPLVANLTDDNNDGVIDLCDTPDIIVTVTHFPDPGHIYVLDGATGALHFMIPTAVTFSINPAIADIDDDGIPEIVAAVGPGFGGPSSAIAFEHDGTVKWQSAGSVQHSQGGAITLADLDNDGYMV